MSHRITITDPASVSAQPLYTRDIDTLADAEKAALLKLIELLGKDAVNATNVQTISTFLTLIANASLDTTNSNAIATLVAAILAGTDVSTVVTAINAL